MESPTDITKLTDLEVPTEAESASKTWIGKEKTSLLSTLETSREPIVQRLITHNDHSLTRNLLNSVLSVLIKSG